MAITISGSGITSANIADGTITTDDILASDVSSLKSGRKNLIINGDFQVSQRGDFASAPVAITGDNYSVDRWNHSGSFGPTVQVLSDGYFRRNLPTAGAYNAYTQQIIEGTNAYLTGKTITISGQARTNSSNFRLWFLEGSAWVSKAVITTGDFAITFTVADSGNLNSPVRFSISDSTSPNVDTTVVANEYFDLKNVQLEVGSVATDFEHRSYGEELALCQRYGLRINNKRRLLGVWGSTTQGKVVVASPVLFRAVPTLTITDMGEVVRESIAWYATTAITVQAEANVGAVILSFTTGASGAAQGDVAWLGNTLDIFLDAEL